MATVETLQLSWRALARIVAGVEEPVGWGYVALRGSGGGWSLGALSVRAPAEVTPVEIRTAEAHLLCETITASAAAGRLARCRANGRRGPRLKFDPPPGGLSVQRLTSDQSGRHFLAGGEWPELYAAYSDSSGALRNQLEVPLASGGPLYPSLRAAVAELLYGATPEALGFQEPPRLLVRVSDRRARLGVPAAEDDALAVPVEAPHGTGSLAGYTLKAAWRTELMDVGWRRVEERLESPSTVMLATGAVPAVLWVVLTDPADRIVDQRGWNDPFGAPLAAEATPGALLARWLAEGEGPRVEFKREIGGKRVNESVAETIVAFANGAGGVILIGVDDDGTVVGYDKPKAADQIVEVARNLVSGGVPLTVETVRYDRRPVQVVRVPAGPVGERPYAVGHRVMIRVGATSRAASPREIRRLVTEDSPAAPIWPRRYR